MDLILPITFTIIPADASCYRVIDSSTLQEVFSSVSKFLSYNEEKRLQLQKDKHKNEYK